MESQKEQSPGGVNRFQAAVRPVRVNPGPFPQRGPWRKLWVSSNWEPAKASVSFPHASSEFQVTFLFSAPGSSNFEGNMAKRGVSGEQACVCCPFCLMPTSPHLCVWNGRQQLAAGRRRCSSSLCHCARLSGHSILLCFLPPNSGPGSLAGLLKQLLCLTQAANRPFEAHPLSSV